MLRRLYPMICDNCKTDQHIQVTVAEDRFIHECVECGWHKFVRRTIYDTQKNVSLEGEQWQPVSH